MDDKIYLTECFKYSTDRTKKLRVMAGTFEQNRDGLTPVMYWTREFYARSMSEAKKKVRKLAKALGMTYANT